MKHDYQLQRFDKLDSTNDWLKRDVYKRQEYGNTSAASIPLALGEMKEKGLLNEGMKLVLSGFGAGFTWAGAYIEL